MLFPTIEFAIFFGLVFPLTWLLNRHNLAKKAFLVAVSYAFYCFWDWRFAFLLLFSSVMNFVAGRLIEAARTEEGRRTVCGLAVALNLLPLAFFKYFDFAAAQAQSFLNLFGFTPQFGSTGLAVPIAISFLTFHGISYVVDVYRGKTEACRSLVDLLLYICFFPHLVAGPIVRAADFLRQLRQPCDPQSIELGKSVTLILGGLFKKVVIASHIATLYVDPIFTDPSSQTPFNLVFGAFAYAIVIYCDFSAYTDIAIGVADLLGYKFPQNFDQPYRALSLQDFWRRWHMTLSAWLRDYLYIPLGGSRDGHARTYRNLILTMLLGGLWHGAGLQFIVWGALHGFGLAAERLAREEVERRNNAAEGLAGRWLASPPMVVLRWAATFGFVCLTWIFFRSPSLAAAGDYLAGIAHGTTHPSDVTLTPFVAVLMVLGFLTQFVPEGVYARWQASYDRGPILAKVGAASLALWATTMLAPEGVAPFIYFQF